MLKLPVLLVLCFPLLLTAQQEKRSQQQPPPQAMNVNPGYWQVTSVAHLPQASTGPSVTHTCVSPSDLSHPERLVDSPYCTTKPVSVTSSSADLTISCNTGNGETTSGTLHLTVNSTTSVTGKAQLQFNANGVNIPATGDYTAKWLDTKCGPVP